MMVQRRLVPLLTWNQSVSSQLLQRHCDPTELESLISC